MDKDKYIGKMLDNRYELLEVIGTGGMAIVYKAKCHRLNRMVAVKILKDEFEKDSELRRRFHVESQAVAMLSHQNIVAVYDVSRLSNIEYIVMELIEGITLKQYMQRKGQLSYKETLHFVTQIVRGLGHAHSKGIIHRDIKPQNIMILRDGSVKVADFGIAHIPVEQNTLTTEAIGSVHYISPEQAKGADVDARSDIYSVGVVMYEMLTGRLPFEGDTPVSVAIQHINSIPLNPREINPDIPEVLERITMKAMSCDPEKRYSSCDEMLKDLEEFRRNPNSTPVIAKAEEETVDEPTVKMKAIKDTKETPKKAEKPQKIKKAKVVEEDDEDEEDDDRRRGGVGGIIAALLAIAVFVGAVIYILSGLVGNMFNEVDEVYVPKLVGEIYEEVVADKNKYGDFKIVIEEEIYDNTYEKGYIIRQDYSEGKSVKVGTTISVVVSRGAKTIRLPNYQGYSESAAKMELGIIKMNYRSTIFEYSTDIEAGDVIRTIPAEGTELTESTYVTLVVSKGKQIFTHSMPDLVYLSQQEAEILMDRYGLILGEVTLENSSKEKGTILSQSFTAGTDVKEGTVINITVSNGIDSGPTTEPTTPPTVGPTVGPTVVPSVTPSETPVTPTDKPLIPSDNQILFKVDISNADTEEVMVLIKQNGFTVHSDTYKRVDKEASMLLTGSGRVVIDVYINGVWKYSTTRTFG